MAIVEFNNLQKVWLEQQLFKHFQCMQMEQEPQKFPYIKIKPSELQNFSLA